MAAAEDLHTRSVGTAYVKLPSGGCAMVTGDDRKFVQPPTGLTVVDKTGAGDAFAGGLAWALLSGQPPVDAAVVAVAAASCAVTRYGSQASYPTPAELRGMTARVRHAMGAAEAG